MYAMTQIQEGMKPFRFGDGHEDRPAGTFILQVIILLVSLFGGVFCMTCLYLAMRGVMRLGGMVATGGPYAIAHPAPGWAWIFPGSILVGLIFIGLNSFASRRAGGLDVLVLAWPALFLSLGWNFLDFGLGLTGGHGLIWAWLVCGVLFVAMGGIPLIFVVRNAFAAMTGGRGESAGSPWSGSRGPGGCNSRVRLSAGGRTMLIVLQLAAMGLGVYGADRFIRVLSGDKTVTAAENPSPHPSRGPASPPPATESRAILPKMLYSPRVVITFEHNTLEILSGENRVFYNGTEFKDAQTLPLEARQVLEQMADYLRLLLGR